MLNVDFTVQSYSIEEDWVSGISFVPFTYSAPYAGRVPFFPSSGAYAASRAAPANQPYLATPWRAVFSGCCNQFPNPRARLPFALEAWVDLTDVVASPRIVTLPQLWLPPGRSTTVLLCATPLAGRAGLLHMSHGTINYPADDGDPAGLDWDAPDGPPGTAFLPPPADPAASPLCRALVIGALSTPHDTLTVRCAVGAGCLGAGDDAGCAVSTAIVALHLAPAATEAPAAIVGNPLGCAPGAACYLLVSAGDDLSESPQAGSANLALTLGLPGGQPHPNPLEARYRVAVRGAPPPGVLATSPPPRAAGRVVFAPAGAPAARAGVPPGWTPWRLGPVEGTCRAAPSTCQYITDVQVYPPTHRRAPTARWRRTP